MANIQVSSVVCKAGATANTINVTRATPVTPYVSKPSAVGPTLSPALSPVQSAITPGLRGSSSLMPKTIFMRSAPMSAILVNIPPAIRSALAPRDSPTAKPIKLAPASSRGTKHSIINIMISSTQTKSTPMLMPASRAIFKSLSGFLSNEVNATLLLAKVFMRIPYQATL